MEELAEAAEAQQPNDQKEVPPSHRLYHVWTTRRNDREGLNSRSRPPHSSQLKKERKRSRDALREYDC